MDSEMFLSILACLAADESQSLSNNVKWGYRKRFEKGIFKYKNAPYGYNIESGNLVINPDEAEIVREIFQRTLAGEGARAIAFSLEERGVPTKRGGKWQQGTIRDMLKNITYTGDSLLQKTFRDETYKAHINRGELDQYYVENEHPAIISHEIFDRVSEEIAERRVQFKSPSIEDDAEKGRKRTGRTVFSKKIFCACCGRVLYRCIYRASKDMKAQGIEYEPVWICSRTAKTGSSCSMPPEKEASISNAFVTMVNKIAFSQRTAHPILDEYIEGMQMVTKSRRTQRNIEIEAELSDIQRERRLLITLSKGAAVQPSLYNDQMATLGRRMNALKEEQNRLDDDVEVKEARDLRRELTKFTDVPMRDFSEAVFRRIVSRVVVNSHVSVRFELYCGLQFTEYCPPSPPSKQALKRERRLAKCQRSHSDT